MGGDAVHSGIVSEIPVQALELLGREEHLGREGIEPFEVVSDRQHGGQSLVDGDLCVVAVPPPTFVPAARANPPRTTSNGVRSYQ